MLRGRELRDLSMPKETTTTWTCSRCGAKVTTKGEDPPANWTEVTFRLLKPEVRAGKVVVDTKPHVIGELCNECGGDHYDWVTGNDEHIARRRAVREAVQIVEDEAARS